MNAEVRSVPIDKIQVADRIRKDAGDLGALAESIRVVGLLQPVVHAPDYRLIAGQRRLEAVRRLGHVEILARFVGGLDDALDLLRAELDENTCRKDFTPEEAVIAAERIEALERQNAADRQKASLKRGSEQPRAGNLPAREKGQTRDKVSAAVGMKPRTYEKAKAVVAARDAEPEKYQPSSR
jgi:ParB/RepB/Spo0J family partition protein